MSSLEAGLQATAWLTMLSVKSSEWPLHSLSSPPVLLPLGALSEVWDWVEKETTETPWAKTRALPPPHALRMTPVLSQGLLSGHRTAGTHLQQWQERPTPSPEWQPAAFWLKSYLSCPLYHFWGPTGMLWALEPSGTYWSDQPGSRQPLTSDSRKVWLGKRMTRHGLQKHQLPAGRALPSYKQARIELKNGNEGVPTIPTP